MSKTFTEFSDNWHNFLVAAKGVWTVLEQGAKETPQSRQWFGGKERLRRGDPLLQYLYEARNDDEHGIEPVVGLLPEQLKIGVAKPGFSQAITINGVIGPGPGLGAGNLNIESRDGKPVLFERTPARVELKRIRARGDRTYDPPDVHQGVKLPSLGPIDIAKTAVTYLEGLVREFEQYS